MSRNLARTDCYFCGGLVRCVEWTRTISKNDCGVYIDEYRGMAVANATCSRCDAHYLAWLGRPDIWPRPIPPPEHVDAIYDLSFRSTFDDEPGITDLPKYHVVEQKVLVPFFASDDGWAKFYMKHFPEQLGQLRAADLVAADMFMESKRTCPHCHRLLGEGVC